MIKWIVLSILVLLLSGSLLNRDPVHLEKQRTIFDPFENVMGISEKSFQQLPLYKQSSYLQNGYLVNQKTGTRYATGLFEQKSLEDLRAELAKKPAGKGCTFHVIEGFDKPWESWFRHKVDITALQADPKNKDAVFQVASNFNALEGNGDPRMGIMPYLSPSLYVQGEAAVLSAMPGTIYRMYYAPHVIQGKKYYGQLEKQVNFLQNFSSTNPPFIPVKNGYLGSIQDIGMFDIASHEQIQEYTGRVVLGFHEGIQVTGGLGPQKSELPIYKAVKITDDTQRVNQVFAAAMMNPSSANLGEQKLARILLNAAYERILKYSEAKNKKKVFLTLIGGGVFNNKLTWIADAIEKAVRGCLNQGNLDIYLVVYYSQEYDSSEWNYLKEKMKTLVEQSGGTYTQYKKD